jgi:hypothetical protein
MLQQECPAHHPYFLEGFAILKRNHVVRDWNKLEIIRRYSDISKNSFFLQHPSDEGGSPGYEKEGICMLLRFCAVSFDLVCGPE